MDILVIAATEGEIATSRAREYKGSHRVEFLVTGVGMTATAYHLGGALQRYQPDLLLNVGVCGSFDRSLALASLVRVNEDIFSEMGAEDDGVFLEGERLGFGACGYTERVSAHYPGLEGIPTARGITVNTVHGHNESIERIIKRLSPTVESMEGASVFYAAHHAQIQCLQIRSVSNYVERRNRDNWQLGKAIGTLNRWLDNFLTGLPV